MKKETCKISNLTRICLCQANRLANRQAVQADLCRWLLLNDTNDTSQTSLECHCHDDMTPPRVLGYHVAIHCHAGAVT